MLSLYLNTFLRGKVTNFFQKGHIKGEKVGENSLK